MRFKKIYLIEFEVRLKIKSHIDVVACCESQLFFISTCLCYPYWRSAMRPHSIFGQTIRCRIH